MRILVVEDNCFLARYLMDEITGSGCEIIGPFARVDDAILCEEPIDAAILAIRLGEETSFPIADFLRHAAIPFLFLAGQAHTALPPRFAGARVYRKPGPTAIMLQYLQAQRDRHPPCAPETIEQIVAAMLVHARTTMPDPAAAERLVMVVLQQAIRAGAQARPAKEAKYWLFEMLEQEMHRHWRLYLH